MPTKVAMAVAVEIAVVAVAVVVVASFPHLANDRLICH